MKHSAVIGVWTHHHFPTNQLCGSTGQKAQLTSLAKRFIWRNIKKNTALGNQVVPYDIDMVNAYLTPTIDNVTTRGLWAPRGLFIDNLLYSPGIYHDPFMVGNRYR